MEVKKSTAYPPIHAYPYPVAIARSKKPVTNLIPPICKHKMSSDHLPTNLQEPETGSHFLICPGFEHISLLALKVRG